MRGLVCLSGSVAQGEARSIHRRGLWSQTTCVVQISALLLSSSVTLKKLFNLYVPQYASVKWV